MRKQACPKVVSVVLNWNRPKDTIECVNSLLSSSVQSDICIVDNGSKDNSYKIFKSQKRWLKRVTILKNRKNEGYVGNNTGLKWALARGAEFVFIINNDAVVEKTALSKLVDVLEREPAAAIATPLTVFYNRPEIVWTAGARFNPVIFKAGLRGEGKPSSVFKQIEQVPLATGAAMLVRARAIRQAGLLDPKYFAYYEETKWQHRMKQVGWIILLVPQARVRHHVAASTGGGESPLSTYYLVRNRGFFIADECPAILKPIAYTSLALEVLGRSAIALVKMRPANAAMAFSGLFDFVLGKGGKKK